MTTTGPAVALFVAGKPAALGAVLIGNHAYAPLGPDLQSAFLTLRVQLSSGADEKSLQAVIVRYEPREFSVTAFVRANTATAAIVENDVTGPTRTSTRSIEARVLVNGTTLLVPLRWFTELGGGTAQWNGAHKRVSLRPAAASEPEAAREADAARFLRQHIEASRTLQHEAEVLK